MDDPLVNFLDMYFCVCDRKCEVCRPTFAFIKPTNANFENTTPIPKLGEHVKFTTLAY